MIEGPQSYMQAVLFRVDFNEHGRVVWIDNSGVVLNEDVAIVLKPLR